MVFLLCGFLYVYHKFPALKNSCHPGDMRMVFPLCGFFHDSLGLQTWRMPCHRQCKQRAYFMIDFFCGIGCESSLYWDFGKLSDRLDN